jgi:hypothetical protein
MSTMYHIDITNGVFTITGSDKAPRASTEYHAPNAKQYFARRGKAKPSPVKVRGWPFAKVYITHGTEENGLAVAWA